MSLYAGFWDFWELNQKVNFDGENKLIIISPFVTDLDIKIDIYSDWKEWVSMEERNNARWDQALRTIGGDPTVGIETAGDIYFLINGWRIVADFSSLASITGVLFSDDYDTPWWVDKGAGLLGPFSPVRVSSIVTGINLNSLVADIWNAQLSLYQEAGSAGKSLSTASTGGVDTGVLAAAVWDEDITTHNTANSAGEALQNADAVTNIDAAAIADAVWDESNSAHNTDGTMGHLMNYQHHIEKMVFLDPDAIVNGDGSQENPYNVLNDAIDRAESENIRNIKLMADIVLQRNLKNFTIIGQGTPEVDLNGYDMKNTEFHRVKIKGTYTDSIIVQESVLLNGMHLNGFFENCALAGDLTCIDSGQVLLKNCSSNIPGLSRPTISMNGAGSSQLSIRGYSGGLTIKDCNNAFDEVTVEVSQGSLTFDSSCTAGNMVARGIGKFVDATAGAIVTNEMINYETIENTVWDASIANHNTAGSFGEANQLGGLTSQQETMILEMYNLMGLDPSKPLVVTKTARTAGAGISQTITGDANSTTVTRI